LLNVPHVVTKICRDGKTSHYRKPSGDWRTHQANIHCRLLDLGIPTRVAPMQLNARTAELARKLQ
jgi:hypothetical protein